MLRLTFILLAILNISINLGCDSTTPPTNQESAVPQTSSTAPNDSVQTGAAHTDPTTETPDSPQKIDDTASLMALEKCGATMRRDGDGFVTEVNFRGLTIDDSILTHLPSLPKLQSVLLNETAISDEGLVGISGLTAIRNLDMRGCGISNDAMKHLTGLSTLVALRLSGKNGATTIDDEALADIAKLPKLKVLALDFLWISGDGLSLLEPSEQLTELYLAKTLVDDDAMAIIKDRFPNLKKLRVAQTQISTAGLSHLTELANLEDLDLSENSLLFDDAMEPVGQMTQLQRLNLWRVAITDTGVGQLVGLTKLRWLNLDNTQLSDGGLEYLAAMSELAFLHLGSTAISDAGLTHLERLTQLEDLKVTRTAITEAGAKALQTKLPETEIQLRYIDGQ
ncbi:MAG: hypothetical protein MK165_05085 [Pirellulaceae bacterium]|nr:hypothetical protein [Pirellulaceae bacterium]